MYGFFDRKGDDPKNTRIKLQNALSKKDYRKLNTLTRDSMPITKETIDKYKDIKPSTLHINLRRTLAVARKVIALYEKARVDKDSMIRHWNSNRNFQLYTRAKYCTMPKNERKDNKTYINYGSGGPGRSSIRYPSKKRKTAWKRFYKLFPHLKPEETEK